MPDRRRTARFEIPEASDGSLRLMQDVFVEHADAATVIVVSDAPLPRTEELLVELPREFGTRTVVQVHVAGSTASWSGDTRRHRLVLRVDGPAGGESRGPEPDSQEWALRTALPAIGVVVRRVPVRVRDVSASGCLLESADMLPEGSVGLLEIVMSGARQTETLRICRSTRAPGSVAGWRSGATFLALSAPAPASVRNMVARFEIIDELGEMPDTLARMYRRLPPPPAHLNSAHAAPLSSDARRAQEP